MMWSNAGSFLAPKQVVLPTTGSSDDVSSEAEDLDIDFTVTTSMQTPCALDITRRHPFFGVAKSLVDKPSFFAQRSDVQAPRSVHEVRSAKINLFMLCTHIIFAQIYFLHTYI